MARLAGVPRDVNERAKAILSTLEQHNVQQPSSSAKVIRPKKQRSGDLQLLLFEPSEHPLLDKIRELDCNQLTPLAALQAIQKLAATVKEVIAVSQAAKCFAKKYKIRGTQIDADVD